MRQPPLDMGDAFVVDDGDLGITVKIKGSRTIQEVRDLWPEEQEKRLAYQEFETATFFNEIGTAKFLEWLEGRMAVSTSSKNSP